MPDDHATYLRVAGRGDLTGRVVGALWWEHDDGLEQIEALVARRAEGPVGRYAATSVKLMLDGIIENHTAAMLDPYFAPDGTPTDNRGMTFIDPEMLLQTVPRLDALGFQAHFHALGDRAVRVGLDAIEAARRQNGWTDTRPHLAHLQVVHPDDLPRFRSSGRSRTSRRCGPCTRPRWTTSRCPSSARSSSARQYPLRSFRRHGVTVAMGSDWSVSTADPFAQMDIAVNRVIPGDEAGIERVHARGGDRADRGAGRVHRRLGVREPPRRGGRRSRLAGSPTSPSSTATCSIAAPAASPTRRSWRTVVDGVLVHETPELGG